MIMVTRSPRGRRCDLARKSVSEIYIPYDCKGLVSKRTVEAAHGAFKVGKRGDGQQIRGYRGIFKRSLGQ